MQATDLVFGGYYIDIDSVAAAAYWAQVPGSAVVDQPTDADNVYTQLYSFHCGSKLPDLTISFGIAVGSTASATNTGAKLQQFTLKTAKGDKHN
ncbi:hypothetical protein MMC25_000932 [Agyrium rufum]|nr:hypothetical protein [Agyrium rufum]